MSELLISPVQRLLEIKETNPITLFLESLERDGLLEKDPVIICRHCDETLTRPELVAVINDNTHHFFTNPSGMGFEVICFESADGCVISGKPTDFFTWFPGFYWQYAYCRGCAHHIGWYYSHPEKQGFFGLVAEHLLGLENI